MEEYQELEENTSENIVIKRIKQAWCPCLCGIFVILLCISCLIIVILTLFYMPVVKKDTYNFFIIGDWVNTFFVSYSGYKYRCSEKCCIFNEFSHESYKYGLCNFNWKSFLSRWC